MTRPRQGEKTSVVKTPPAILKLTEAAVKNLEPIPGKQKVYWDLELKGFGVRVGGRSKTFIAQRRVRGVTKQPRQITIGRYPTKNAQEARDEARGYLNQLYDGEDPLVQRRERQGGVRFSEAWTLYQQYLKAKKKSAKTVARYSQYVGKYLQDWLDRPLTQFNPKWLREQHQQLAADVARGKYAQEIQHPKKYGKRKGAKIKPFNRTGENTANDVFRFLRAVYLKARKGERTLPENPFDDINWFSLEPRRAAIPAEHLSQWYAGVREVPNPVRRDCLLFILFTGLRKDSAVNVKWEHVDFERRTVFIETAKGGKKRQFTLPLSDYLVDLLQGRKVENEELGKQKLVPAKSPWVFPCNAGDNESASGHIVDPRVKINGVPFIIHGLRNTFLTQAAHAGVDPYAMETLANHRPPKSSQTAKYLAPNIEWLRIPMQTTTNRLRSLLEADNEPDNVVSLPGRRVA